MHGLVEHADLDDARHDTAQGRRQRRLAQAPVAAVGDDDRVAGEALALLLEVGAQVLGPGLLLALDEHRDADRRLSLKGAQRREVRDHAGLVVRAAAAEEAPVAHGRRERRRAPLAFGARGLDVVMGVEEDRRRARRRREVADDRRVALCAAEDLHLGADVAEHPGDGVRGAAERLGVPAGGAHRRDGDERLEVLLDLGHAFLDARPEGGGRRSHHEEYQTL